MDIDHVSKHEPQTTRDQWFTLGAMSNEKLSFAFDKYLFDLGHNKGVTKARAIRYRDGYFKSSAGYENGPPQEFKDFVAQL